MISIENVKAGAGNDIVKGSEAANTLYGQSGDDELFGKGGDDLLKGGAGNDWLSGGKGSDKITGGLGKDVFELSKGSGFSKVMDLDFQDDLIYIDSQLNSLSFKDAGHNLRIYPENDLLGIIKKGAGYLPIDAGVGLVYLGSIESNPS